MRASTGSAWSRDAAEQPIDQHDLGCSVNASNGVLIGIGGVSGLATGIGLIAV